MDVDAFGSGGGAIGVKLDGEMVGDGEMFGVGAERYVHIFQIE